MNDALVDGTAAGNRLRAFMSALCRDAYGVDWADHLEFALWHALVNGPMRYGQLLLTARHLDELRRLRDACGGWILVQRDGVVRQVSLQAWQDLYTGNVELVRMEHPIWPPGAQSGGIDGGPT